MKGKETVAFVLGTVAFLCGVAYMASSAEATIVVVGNETAEPKNVNDTWVDSSNPTTNNGADGNLIVNQNRPARALIGFNLTTAAIPEGSVVSNATLYLSWRQGGVGTASNYWAYNISSALNHYAGFGEFNATWNNQPCGTGAPAYPCANPSANVSFTPANPSTVGIPVTAAVQSVVTTGNRTVSFMVMSDRAVDEFGFCSKNAPDTATPCTAATVVHLYIDYVTPVAPTLTMNNTYNGTTLENDNRFLYSQANTSFEVNVTDGDNDPWGATFIMDGRNYTRATTDFTVYNNTLGRFWINFTSRTMGVHTFRWCANDTGGREACTPVLPLDVQSHVIVSTTSNSPIFEANWTLFNATFDVAGNISAPNAYLWWNGTNMSFDFSTSVGNRWSIGKNLTVPFLFVNDSSAPHGWNISLPLSNGTLLRNDTSTVNQSLLFAFFFNDLTGTTQALKVDSFSARVTAMNRLFVQNGLYMTASINFNGTTLNNATFTQNFSWTGPNFLTSWNFSGNVPNITGVNNASLIYNATVTVFNGSQSRTQTGRGSLTLFIYNPLLAACGSAALPNNNIPVLSLYTYNETTNRNTSLITDVNVTTTIDAAFSIFPSGNRSNYMNSSFQVSGGRNYFVCMYPANATFRTDAEFRYQADQHEPRSYFLTNASLTAPPNEIKLFLLHNDAPAYLFPISLKDSANNILVGYTVQALRYYVQTNSYEVVNMAKSDQFGVSNMWLAPNNVYYKFLVYNDQVLSGTIDRRLLTCTVSTACNLNLIIDTSAGIASFNYLNKIFSVCTWTNSSLTLSCTWTDSTGLASQMCLDIKEFGYIRPIQTAYTCVTSASGTVGHTFGLYNSSTQYFYQLVGILENGAVDNTTIVSSGWIQNHGQPIAGSSGLVLAFIVIGTIAVIGLVSPVTGILLMLFGMGAMSMMQIIDLGSGGVAGLVLVGLVVLWYIRRGS